MMLPTGITGNYQLIVTAQLNLTRIGSEIHVHVQLKHSCYMILFSELQNINDVGYLRKTLAVEKTDKEALAYFQV